MTIAVSALLVLLAGATAAPPPSPRGEGGPAARAGGPDSGAWNGLPPGAASGDVRGPGDLKAMLWKYVARCALPEGKQLEAPPGPNGEIRRFDGFFGAAPEWNEGACDHACQEKVTGCLLALTNRTGKHVLVSLLGHDPSLGKKFVPDRNEIAFPYQEGAFFGNLFANETYACQGTDARKGQQVKRFCALEPSTCGGLTQLAGAGHCQDVCAMACSVLPDKTERCVASSCKDPKGRRWDHPITVFLRNKIEAANADALVGVIARDDGIDGLDDGDSATYEHVDLALGPAAFRTFAATFVQRRPPGRIEIWVDGSTRIGVLDLQAPPGRVGELSTRVTAPTASGPHQVTLRFVGGKDMGRLSLIEFR